MCGRLSQYSGIHDFVAALSTPNALVNSAGDLPLERYNGAPSQQIALFHQEMDVLHADLVPWGWRPAWDKDRAAPINAGSRKSPTVPSTVRYGRNCTITPIDNWWADEEAEETALPYPPAEPVPDILCGHRLVLHRRRKPGEHDDFAIITANSAGGMVDIHDRRPMVLGADLSREWLDPATPKEPAEQIVLQQDEPAEAFEWIKVDPGYRQCEESQKSINNIN